jgi:hypothetical protein
MRRRVRENKSTPAAWLENPDFPPFVDNLKSSVRKRHEAWEQWMDEHFRPWQQARAEYEKANEVVFVDLDVSMVPDEPWDPSLI